MYDKEKVLIVGTDINSYYMARCYNELTGKKADVMGNRAIPYTNITNSIIIEDFNNIENFKKALIEYGEKNKKNKILLVATSDLYVRLITEQKEILEKYYIFNYPDISIVNNLLLKENFYKNYNNMGLDMPKTFIYSCNKKEDNSNEIDKIKEIFKEYPIIIKPSDGIEYHKIDNLELAKVYKVYNDEELENVIKKIEKNGYNNNLIIQEFIPGDDSALFDSIFYVNKNRKAQFATFAQIGLQERTPTGIGNCTVLVNGFDEHGYNEEIVLKLKEFLEKIGYQGFAEFDIKYDIRDGKYKVLEINPRQSRSGYYVCGCGKNLIKVLMDDLFYNKNEKFEIIKEKCVLSFVPYLIIKKYIKNNNLLNEIKNIKKHKKIINPLNYKNDKNIKRKIYLFYRKINYIKKYKKYFF